MHLVVDHRSLNLHVLSGQLGADSSRIKQFVVQQAEGSEALNEIQITLTRVSPAEYAAIRERLKTARGVQKPTRT